MKIFVKWIFTWGYIRFGVIAVSTNTPHVTINGKFILYANILYLYLHLTNPPTSLGDLGESGFFFWGGEAYVSDIWPLKNLGEFP